MSFDKPTRNALAKMVGGCRRLLTADIRDQLQRVYGLQPDGTDLPVATLGHLDERGKQTAVELREWHKHLASTEPGSDTKRRATAFDRLADETAFTSLNRLAALRLCEERGHVIECVRRGMESDGFKLFERLSGGGLGSRGTTYRAFLERMFDELAVDLGVLFDRRAPQSLVFPGETCLERVLELLNDSNLLHLWQYDETIGWMYQYFNGDEPAEMRKAAKGGPPRNSHELAVRNQFFTPRYVVEFLTENTLGRIWYEMRRADTRLTKHCHYLVRRSNEVFLEPGQDAPQDQSSDQKLSQADLLRRTVYVPFRAKKDPRDLKILDPACGSGHFLLYAFDLLQMIYEEAWEDESCPASESNGNRLRDVYSDLAQLRREVPSLILRHNLYGIEIDQRCCQIAALALWLRAQRSYQSLGLKAGERPQITRSNIVCAEAMPGESELLQEFVAELMPPLLRQLVRSVFEETKLAGEAGSLLKIDEALRASIAEAKKQWIASTAPEQLLLLPELRRRTAEQLTLFDVSNITDEAFWEDAEARVIEALENYAGSAANGRAYRRRLFAEDAVEGFAFVDICRKRFDVALMNPPFGKPSTRTETYYDSHYADFKSDVGIAFVERGTSLLAVGGTLGAITSRSFIASDSLIRWRDSRLLEHTPVFAMLDLGYGVLDDAMVEAACYVLDNGPKPNYPRLFWRALEVREKETAVRDWFEKSRQDPSFLMFAHDLKEFRKVPLTVLCYWLPASILAKIVDLPALDDAGGAARHGLVTTDDFRFLRLAWEIPAVGSWKSGRWRLLAKGGEYEPFWDDLHLVVDWGENGSVLKEFLAAKRLETQGSADWTPWLNHSEFYLLPGLTYPERTTSDFCLRILPEDVIFSSVGQAIQFTKETQAFAYLAGSFSRFFKLVVEGFVGSGDNAFPGSAAKHYRSGLLNQIPPPLTELSEATESRVANAIEHFRARGRSNETTRDFLAPERGQSFIAIAQQSTTRWLRQCLEILQLHVDIETLITKRFELSDEDEKVVEQIVGPHPCRYPALSLTDAKVTELWRLPLPKLVARAVETRGARRQITKKSYIADRRLELVCHLIQASPESVVASLQRTGVTPPTLLEELCRDELSYAVGVVFGRWDVRCATVKKPQVPSGGPFSPLPGRQPGMLPSDSAALDGPLKLPADYPLNVCRAGILVDEDGHSEDIVRRVRDVLGLLWRDQAEAVEQEICEALSIRGIRDYFHMSSGFFSDHLARYSKSRRQAPIYWPLSTTSGSYTLWFYYDRLDDEMLYRAVNDYINPRIVETERQLRQAEDLLPTSTGRDATRLRGEFEARNTLLGELQDLKAELLKVAALPYRPNLNDGVLVTAAPLWRFFQLPKWRKQLDDCWKELESGGYNWTHLAYSIWPDRIREECKKDRSLAITHGLEDLCEVAAAGTSAKKRERRRGKAIVSRQINIEEMETKGSEE